MPRSLSSALLIAVGCGAGLILSGVASGKAPRESAPVKVLAAPATDVQPGAVEYKFFIPSSSAAITSEHEKALNALGAQGWKVATPIYAGGILNSYLMVRPKR